MTLADVFGAGTPLTGTGPDGKPKEYLLRELTLLEQGEFQRWLEQRAHDAVDRSSAKEEAKDRRHAAIDRDAALGRYEFDGDLSVASRFTVAGMTQCLKIVLRAQGATPEEVEALMRDKLKRVAAEILSKAASDPKAVAPVLEALGLPTDFLTAAPAASSSDS